MKVVKHLPAPAPPPTYDLLGLTQAEVEVLRVILDRIGGDPNGPRGHADTINEALADAGIGVVDIAVDNDAGAIYFK